MYPTIAAVLALPAVRAGAPAVRAGRAALDAEVRWVHVSELAEPAGTLPAGVLVLSVGLPLADPTTDPARYVEALRAAGAAGLLIELGQQLAGLPDGLVQAARAAGFPLVEIRRTVRFAEIIETVLGRILNSQHDRAAFAERAGGAFRALSLHGAGPDRIVGEAAALLGRPVVLEDPAHRVLVDAGTVPESDLRDWTTRSRLAPVGDDAGPEGWTVRAVGPPGAPWGRIVVPARPAPDPAAREATVLTLAAEALSLPGGTADPVTLVRAARAALLRDLAAATPADTDRLDARARALGIDAAATFEVLVLVPPVPDPPPAGPGHRARDRTPAGILHAAVDAAVGEAGPVGAAGPGGGTAGPPATATVAGLVLVLAAQPWPVAAVLGALPPGAVDTAAAAGPGPLERVPELLREARRTAEARTGTGSAATVRPAAHRRAGLGARGLVWELRDDPRLLAFVTGQLGPVLALEPAERDRALRGLRAYVDSGGVVADFARRIGVGRPAAYARLGRLAELVGADLADPEVRTSLHLALLAAPG